MVGVMSLTMRVILVIACGAFLLYAAHHPRHHRYSDVPGQDHPYCPPDPSECG